MEPMPGAVASTDQLGLAPERALWEAMGCIADDEACLRMLSAHIAAAVAAERERWQKAFAATGFLINPLKPAGEPGSYARGFDVGVETALRTLRDNLGPNAAGKAPAR